MDCFKIHAILSDKCGLVEFNPASGTIGRGSYVAMTCENAVKIKYWFGDDEESAETVPVADVQINGDCTLNAKGIKADDVEGEAVYYNLQGVRVENPVKGIYIRVANGKSAKVIM